MGNIFKSSTLSLKTCFLKGIQYVFKENDSLLYSLAVISYLIFGGLIFCFIDPVRVALLLNCFVFVIIAYGVDMVALFGFKPSPEGKEEVNIFHVFTVCWFLPFLLTLTPVFRDVLDEDYRRLPEKQAVTFNNLDTVPFEHRIHLLQWPKDLDSEPCNEDESRYFWKILIILAREIVFGSVIVLIPLEFFSLMFTPDSLKELHDPKYPDKRTIEVDSHKTSRHSLIAAGVLDLVTLILLVAVLPKSMIESYMYSRVTNILFFCTLMVLFFVSFLSSFRAIWVATYYHKNPSRSYQEKPGVGEGSPLKGM